MPLKQNQFYRLKKGNPNFSETDGEHKGKKYVHGGLYKDIPPSKEKWFEVVDNEKISSEKAAAHEARVKASGKKTEPKSSGNEKVEDEKNGGGK